MRKTLKTIPASRPTARNIPKNRPSNSAGTTSLIKAPKTVFDTVVSASKTNQDDAKTKRTQAFNPGELLPRKPSSQRPIAGLKATPAMATAANGVGTRRKGRRRPQRPRWRSDQTPITGPKSMPSAFGSEPTSKPMSRSDDPWRFMSNCATGSTARCLIVQAKSPQRSHRNKTVNPAPV